MNKQNELALVPRSPTAIENVERGAKRVLSSMVADALALARPPAIRSLQVVTMDEVAESRKRGRLVLDQGAFWSFPGYEGINFPKTLCRRTMAREEYVNMLRSESPIYLKGFVSKSGKSFTAAIVLLPQEKKLYFEFPPG